MRHLAAIGEMEWRGGFGAHQVWPKEEKKGQRWPFDWRDKAVPSVTAHSCARAQAATLRTVHVYCAHSRTHKRVQCVRACPHGLFAIAGCCSQAAAHRSRAAGRGRGLIFSPAIFFFVFLQKFLANSDNILEKLIKIKGFEILNENFCKVVDRKYCSFKFVTYQKVRVLHGNSCHPYYSSICYMQSG